MTPPPALRLTGQHRIDARPLFDVDMTLAAGAWTCLLGPSGVGKSTVLRLLLGLETGGAFDGTITASDGQPLAGRISYMAQSDLLLPWLTVIENIMIGDRLRGTTPDRDRASAMLARVGLQDTALRGRLRVAGLEPISGQAARLRAGAPRLRETRAAAAGFTGRRRRAS